MTIFSKKDNKIETLNARETAPGAATEDMYHGDEKLSEKGTHISILILKLMKSLFDHFLCNQPYFITSFEHFIKRSSVNRRARRNIWLLRGEEKVWQ